MMTSPEIAHRILSMARTPSTVIMAGKLQEELGIEAYQDVLRKGWVCANPDLGYMTLTTQGGQLDEMRQLAQEYQQQQQQQIRQQPVSDTDPDSKTTQVGDQAVVSADGRVFTGTVQSVNPDGTFKLSFSGSERPKDMNRAYRRNEVKLTNRATTAPAGTPAPRTPQPGTLTR